MLVVAAARLGDEAAITETAHCCISYFQFTTIEQGETCLASQEIMQQRGICSWATAALLWA